MRLEELAAMPLPRPKHGAPDWLLGCFKRRSITFFTGKTDVDTSVYWLQTRGLSADFRMQPDRSDLLGRSYLRECNRAELASLAVSEGGFSETEWDGERMTWFGWTAFQLHPKWSESGKLMRVGDCLIEVAPSGAYVEDWRLQRSTEGPLVGLRLLEEREMKTGKVTHRGGGLIVCGEHAAFVRGRPENFSRQGRLSEVVGDGGGLSPGLIDEIFSCEASYARRRASRDGYMVVLSTNPLREGEELMSLDGFSYDIATQLVTQRTREYGILLERTFMADTLEPTFKTEMGTLATPQAHAWLRQEADTLLAYAEIPPDDLPNHKPLTRNRSHVAYSRPHTSLVP